MYTWLEPQEIHIPEELHQLAGGQPLLGKILAQRGLTTLPVARAFLQPEFYTPTPASALPGISQAADRLQSAISHKEPLCVWGDFDVDGQTSTTVLVSALQDLGAQVRFHIPVRERESHGVNLPGLKQCILDGSRIILTCDTGITAHEAVEYAHSQGVEFIITDHHDLPPELPPASVIVNPKLLPGTHPFYNLPGVGVAYLLAQELYQRVKRGDEPTKHLDLLALGIVADLAMQTGECRYLLQCGLRALRATRRLGLITLMETAEVNPLRLTEEHIGYLLAPRLNALGRLADANVIVEFFTTSDLLQARTIANHLEGLNARRQLLTNQVYQAALAQIERDPSLSEEAVLVLANPTWPAGVIGIVASRLVERYHRPVVLISAPAGEMGRGSARSIEGCNITAAIAAHGELLAGFGGHPMAAGLSIEPQRIPEFRSALSRTIRSMVSETQRVSDLRIDEYLPLSQISLDFVENLESLAPFGPGNPPLTLASRNLSLVSHTTLGRHADHLQVIVADEQGNQQKVIWWQGAGGDLPQGRFDLAYSVRSSDYRGQRAIQIEWIDARPVTEPLEIQETAPSIQIVDYRRQAQPVAILKNLLAERPVQIWCEGEAAKQLAGVGIQGCRRDQLLPCQALAIWTTPPGRSELQDGIQRVKPQIVYLFLVDPGEVSLEDFLKRLAGLVKYTMQKNAGQVAISTLAAATAQREATVRTGLAWLAARGDISIKDEAGGHLSLVKLNTNRLPSDETIQYQQQLEAMLQETNAFRHYLLDSLISFFGFLLTGRVASNDDG